MTPVTSWQGILMTCVPIEKAQEFMEEFQSKVPQWSDKHEYTRDETLSSLNSAYKADRQSPWIPRGLLEEFQKESEAITLGSVSEIPVPEEQKPLYYKYKKSSKTL